MKSAVATLATLQDVELNAASLSRYALVEAQNAGPTAWRRRKLAETRDVLALAQVSNRLTIHWIDPTAELRIYLDMKVTVPCLAHPAAALQIGSTARLGITYRQEATLLPQPGFSFVQIAAPAHVWLPSVSAQPGRSQLLCLGASLPAGVLVKELILMTYGALTMQSIQMDPGDEAGVMNAEACNWWQHNLKRLPLSREPFISRPRDQR